MDLSDNAGILSDVKLAQFVEAEKYIAIKFLLLMLKNKNNYSTKKLNTTILPDLCSNPNHPRRFYSSYWT